MSKFHIFPIFLPNPGRGINPQMSRSVAGGISNLIHSTVVGVMNRVVERRVNTGLRILEPIIQHSHDQWIANNRRRGELALEPGVLIVAEIQEYRIPDPTGTRNQIFKGIHIGGTGLEYTEVLQHYVRTPRMTNGADTGYVMKFHYLWAMQ